MTRRTTTVSDDLHRLEVANRRAELLDAMRGHGAAMIPPAGVLVVTQRRTGVWTARISQRVEVGTITHVEV